MSARVLLLLVAVLPVGRATEAQPDFASGRAVGALTVYDDASLPGTHYYAPPALQLAARPGGLAVELVRVRYSGSLARGDAGATYQTSVLSLALEPQHVGGAALEDAQRRLRPGGAAVRLRPLPIDHLEVAAVYASADTSLALPRGSLDHRVSRYRNLPERVTFSARLDTDTSDLLWALIQRGEAVLLVSYAYVAEGVVGGRAEGDPTTSGPPEIDSLLTSRLVEARVAGRTGAGELTRLPVFADAFPVRADTSHVAHLDLADRLPPGFPFLEVLCFDFADGLRPDLRVKHVDLEAESPGGGVTRARASFRHADPSAYARPVRFGFAARLDRPYRYRVTEITADGTRSAGPWVAQERWASALDVTSATEVPPQALPAHD